jgi:predicted Zn-dependent peptidase
MEFEFNFRAGEYLTSKKKWETPHLMEHILLGANKVYPKSRLFLAELDKNGAYSNASTDAYDITYEAECADFEWERVRDLLILAITEPLFLQDEFTAEFGNVREELAGRSNNHFRHLSLALREKYGFIVKTDQERLELMSNVTVNDVRRHYKKTHTSRNLRFVIAGNITPRRYDDIVAALGHINLPLGDERLALPDERLRKQDMPLHIYNKTIKNIYFYIDTFMNRRMDDAETHALSLANTMLTETLYSKILGTARERGLLYGMSSGFAQTKETSNWWFGAQVSQKNIEALFEIIVVELEKVFNGKIGADDIEAAKANSLGRFQRSAQTVGGTASGYSERYFFDEVIDDYYQVPKRIKEISKTAIVDIARALFADNIWGLGMLGNCDSELVERQNAQIAQLWQLGRL